jgi:hypothetical protein
MRPTPVLPLLHGLCASVTIALGVGAAAQARGPSTVEHAIVHTVTNCDDSGPGSLREAVGISWTGDTVDLSQLPCSDSTITLTTGAVEITIDGLTIAGVPLARIGAGALGGATGLPIIDGNGQGRVFDHTGTGTLQLFDLGLRNGASDGPGGCLHSSGNITLVESTVSGCTVNATSLGAGAGGGVSVDNELYMSDSRVTGNAVNADSFVKGGGVFVNGPLTMTRSTIADNTAIASSGAFGFGGGVYAANSVALSYSTISGNRATDIGGVDLLGADGTADLSIVNTTISGNTGGVVGGLLALQSPLKIASSTIAFNTATIAAGTGGVAVGNPSTLQSTLIAHNVAADAASDLRGQCGVVTCTPAIAGANNLVMSTTLPMPADTLGGDPLLASLANNGGPTLTHAIASDSPAIDHGNATGTGAACLTLDQRGGDYLRVFDAAPDIGSFERGSGPDSIFASGFEAPSEGRSALDRPVVCP